MWLKHNSSVNAKHDLANSIASDRCSEAACSLWKLKLLLGANPAKWAKEHSFANTSNSKNKITDRPHWKSSKEHGIAEGWLAYQEEACRAETGIQIFTIAPHNNLSCSSHTKPHCASTLVRTVVRGWSLQSPQPQAVLFFNVCTVHALMLAMVHLIST